MKQKVKTSLALAKNLFTTGAIRETTNLVEIEVCKFIPTDKAIRVVEFGIGHGNLTAKILEKMSSESKLIAFEVNKEFCDHVRAKLPDDRLTIINDGAENIKKHIDYKIDFVIATIPFSFFSKDKASAIIQGSYDLLSDGGYYSQALYTKFNFKKFQKVFSNAELIAVNKLPPEYVYHCQK